MHTREREREVGKQIERDSVPVVNSPSSQQGLFIRGTPDSCPDLNPKTNKHTANKTLTRIPITHILYSIMTTITDLH